MLRRRAPRSAWTILLCGFFAGTPALAGGVSTTTSAELNAPEPAKPQVSVELSYAQSQDAWKTVDQVKSAQGNLDQINQVLHDNYGTYEEAFARAEVGISGLRSGLDSSLLRSVYFGTSSEALAFGMVQNPVVPELQADALLTGEINSGFEGSIDALGLQTRMGGHFGMGYEKRVDAVSTDLIENIPTENGRLSYYGADAELGRDFQLAPDLAIRSRASVSETSFYSSIDSGKSTYVRWKLKDDLKQGLGSVLFDKDSLSLETIAGPQPLPVDFLPRTWDYIDQLNPFPELGAMLGAGLAWNSTSHGTRIVARGGFYGGYPGGQLGVQAGAFQASLETWGIEASSAYQTLGQRVYAASLGLEL